MTWTDLYRIELQALHAHEEDIVPTLHRIQKQADGAYVHEVLLRLIDAAPSRIGRLSVALSLSGLDAVTRMPKAIEGWEIDVDALLDHHPKGPVIDAAILLLLLKITRLRTAGYEAAVLMARHLGLPDVSTLIDPMYLEDKQSDESAAGVLALLIQSDGRDWEGSFLLSQDQ